MANSQHINWLKRGVSEWNNRRSECSITPNFDGANLAELLCPNPNDGRVHLDKADLRDADIKDATLSFVQMTSANLAAASLNNARLVGTDLSQSILCRTTLLGTDLTDAILRRVICRGADFSGSKLLRTRMHHVDASEISETQPRTSFDFAVCKDADFRDANLESCDFKSADLENADLSRAKLRGANLIGANLIGALLARTEPWKAILFSDDDSTHFDTLTAVVEGRISRIHDLTKRIQRVRLRLPLELGTRFFFRGERQCFPALKPSIMRSDNESIRLHEGKMLMELMSDRPEDFMSASSALEQWGLAQHHGLYTRLLDVTSNPLVALFNATERVDLNDDDHKGYVHIFAVPSSMIKPFNSDAVSVVTNFAKLDLVEQSLLLGKNDTSIPDDGDDAQSYRRAIGRLYHFIRQEKPHFERMIDPRDLFRVFVVEPRRTIDRVRAQSGAFLVSAFHERYESGEIRNYNSKIPVYGHYKVEIPRCKKENIRNELSLFDITRRTMYPGLDETARSLISTYSRGRSEPGGGSGATVAVGWRWGWRRGRR